MWKPIETAPKDATRILVCKANDADAKAACLSCGWDGLRQDLLGDPKMKTLADQYPILQYYYRTTECPASLSTDANCICWYLQGTGPHSGSWPSNQPGSLSWRLKPKVTTHV
jgi:hypothetical protein